VGGIHSGLESAYHQQLLTEAVQALWRHRNGPDAETRKHVRRTLRERISDLRRHRAFYGRA
jgi:hypothetical protein